LTGCPDLKFNYRSTLSGRCSIVIDQMLATEDEILTYYTEVIERLHESWTPHEGQLPIGQALFGDEIREIFLECGRNFGKTEFIDYAVWRNAQTRPGSTNYIFYPLLKQAKEVIWKSKRVLEFGPSDWIAGTNDTELRITLKNGSFIKLDGSDNTESYRGVKIKNGSLVVMDEFKDFKPEFYEAIEPNFIDAYVLIAGTPPERDDCQFIEVADEFQKNPKKRHFNRSCFDNPHISRDFLYSKRDELYLKGDGEIWEREYLAKRVQGGKRSIFPMISSFETTNHRNLIREIARDKSSLEWYIIADPGSATCFAQMFVAINPYTKMIYILDEIYETDANETSVGKIGRRMIEKRNEFYEHKEAWDLGHDEAAKWYENELFDQFKIDSQGVKKKEADKETGLSLIKDIFIEGKIKISDRCTNLLSEMRNYVKDRNGRIPKENDHLIDCFRYLLIFSGYNLNKTEQPVPEKDREDFRAEPLEFNGDDPYRELTDDY